MDPYGGPGGGAIPEDPESDCLMAYAGPELESVFALEVTNNIFLYGAHNGMIKGFYLQEGELACELAGHRGTIRGLLYTGDDRQPDGSDPDAALYSCSVDGTIKAWDLKEQEEKMSYSGHQGSVDCIDWLDGHLASGGRDGTVKIWQQEEVGPGGGVCRQSVKVHAGSVTAMKLYAPSRNQLQCFTVSNDGLAKYIDLEKRKLIAVYEGGGALHCLHHEPEAGWTQLYVAGSSKNVMIYDTRVHTCVGQLRGHTEAILGMVMYHHHEEEGAGENLVGRSPLPDGARVLYTASDDCTIRQWNLKSREEWKLHTNPAAVRPGRTPAHEGREDYTFGGHSAGVSCIKMTRTGVLYSASFDASVRVWDREGAFDNIEQRALREQKAFEEKQAREKRERAEKGKKKGKGKKGKSKSSSKKSGSGKKGGKKKKK